MGDRADAYEPVSTLASGRKTVTNFLIAVASIGTILLTTVAISAQGRGAGRGREGIPPPQSQRPVPVPEPATLTLLAAAGLGGGLLARHLIFRRKSWRTELLLVVTAQPFWSTLLVVFGSSDSTACCWSRITRAGCPPPAWPDGCSMVSARTQCPQC